MYLLIFGNLVPINLDYPANVRLCIPKANAV